MNELERATAILNKLFGVVLIVMGPLTIGTVIFHGFKVMHTVEKLSLSQWVFGCFFGLGLWILGIYLCRREFGWFINKK